MWQSVWCVLQNSKDFPERWQCLYDVLFVHIFACYKTFFMWFVWCRDPTRGTRAVWTEASTRTLTHHSLQRRVLCTSLLHLHKPFFLLLFFLDVGTDNAVTHTHRTINTHSPGSQSADTHQSYECRLASVHWDSWGTNQAMEAAGECHISPPCCTNTHTHTERETTHVPTCTKAEYCLLFLTHIRTMTRSQLSAH